MNKNLLFIVLILVSISLVFSQDEFETSNVVELNPDNISNYVDGPTLIEFFAPWCGHCKKLAPTYKELASHYEGNTKGIKIASLNCEEHSNLCGTYGIRGYPTIKFFTNGNIKDYKGQRDKQSFINYIEQMLESPVVKVESKETLEEILKKPDTNTFIYISSTNESVDTEWFNIFNQIATNIQDTVSPSFVKLSNSDLLEFKASKLPAIILVKEGDYSEFKQDKSEITEWITYNQYPLLSELSPDRISSIGKSFKYIALFVFNEKVSQAQKETIKSIAKSNISKDPREFIYLYFNENVNKKWLSNYEIQKKPTLIVFNSDSLDLYFYNQNITTLDKTAMLDFLSDVRDGKVPIQYTDAFSYYTYVATDMLTKYMYGVAAFTLSIPILVYYLCCREQKEKEQ